MVSTHKYKNFQIVAAAPHKTPSRCPVQDPAAYNDLCGAGGICTIYS